VLNLEMQMVGNHVQLDKNVKSIIYKIKILPMVLYGYATWSVTLREDHRLRVFENRALRRISGPKRKKEIGGCRKLHNEELYNLQSSPSIIRMMKSRRVGWAGYVAWTRIKGMQIGFWWESQKERDY
jgi:hypothetical protein